MDNQEPGEIKLNLNKKDSSSSSSKISSMANEKPSSNYVCDKYVQLFRLSNIILRKSLSFQNSNSHHLSTLSSLFRLPIVEAVATTSSSTSSSCGIFGHQNPMNPNSSIQATSNNNNNNSATTTVCSGLNNNNQTCNCNSSGSRFCSPFSTLSAIDFMHHPSDYTNSSHDITTTNTINNNNNSYNGKTFPASSTMTKNSAEHKQELLVHQQNFNFFSNLKDTLNLWLLNQNSLTCLDVLNQLIVPLSSFQPSPFTIKSIVNSNSPSQQQQQPKTFSQSVNNTRNSNINERSSYEEGFEVLFPSSSATIQSNTIAKTTTTTTTTTSNSILPSLHPSSNYQNNNNIASDNKTTATTTTSNRKFPSSTSAYDETFLAENVEHLNNVDHYQPQNEYFGFTEDNPNVINIEDLEEEYEQQPVDEEASFYQSSHFHQIFSSPQFNHLTLADKIRFERLFKEIDVDGNGVIDFNDLLQALEQKGIQATHENVKHLILRSDINLDGDIDFAEFVSYCLENEKQLRIIFKDIDINSDGKIDPSELVSAFERAGIKVDEQEALRLVKRIKADSKDSNTLELNYTEFRDYLLLHPTDSLQDLMRSWRFGTFVDFGEDGIMPVDFSENEIKSGMWWRHMLAGGVAGAVSRTSTAPLDRLKVFLQVRGAEFNGLGVCLRHMIQEGGVWSLWRGNGINVLKIAPETAMKFMAFDQLKRLIHSGDANSEITILERFLAGSLAGAVSQTVIYPMEVLKTRFCLRQTGQYSGLFDAAQKIYSNGGIKNFYRGYVPNLIGILPYAGIDLTIYETLKKMYMKSHSLEEAPVYVCLSCGTVSSTFGQIASYPLALIRTRMQSESGNHRSSMIPMFKKILQNEGPRGLYRGITANIMKVAPAVSISYVVYEYTRRPLGAVMS